MEWFIYSDTPGMGLKKRIEEEKGFINIQITVVNGLEYQSGGVERKPFPLLLPCNNR